MESWYSIALGDVLTAQLALAEIRDAFESARLPGGDSGRAAFTRQVSGDLHCEVTVYFSPAVADLARRFGAQPCMAPGKRSLELLAGDASCADQLRA